MPFESGSGGGSTATSYKALAGDTWASISKKLYGSDQYAARLMSLNGGGSVSPGSVISIPSATVTKPPTTVFKPAVSQSTAAIGSLGVTSTNQVTQPTTAPFTSNIPTGLVPASNALLSSGASLVNKLGTSQPAPNPLVFPRGLGGPRLSPQPTLAPAPQPTVKQPPLPGERVAVTDSGAPDRPRGATSSVTPQHESLLQPIINEINNPDTLAKTNKLRDMFELGNFPNIVSYQDAFAWGRAQMYGLYGNTYMANPITKEILDQNMFDMGYVWDAVSKSYIYGGAGSSGVVASGGGGSGYTQYSNSGYGGGYGSGSRYSNENPWSVASSTLAFRAATG